MCNNFIWSRATAQHGSDGVHVHVIFYYNNLFFYINLLATKYVQF